MGMGMVVTAVCLGDCGIRLSYLWWVCLELDGVYNIFATCVWWAQCSCFNHN